MRLGLIGKNIQHSKSKQVYSRLISTDFEYDLIDIQTIEDLPDLKNLFQKYDGLNVTSPYKSSFTKQIDGFPTELSDLKIINTLKLDGGKVVADNTDYRAILEILPKLVTVRNIKKIAILGDGNMSIVVRKVLDILHISSNIFSRRIGNLSSQALSQWSDLDTLVINCCAREFKPDLSNVIFKQFWNLNYSQPEIEEQVVTAGLLYLDGQELLELQAEYALRFWNI